jgi:hypothetical protein
MIDHYVSWREECTAVAHAYQQWKAAHRQDRSLAFSAYVAALDREERAAASYQALAEQSAPVAAGVPADSDAPADSNPQSG